MKRTLIFAVIALLVIQATFAQEAEVCTEGESKKSDDNCNDCYCTKGGWACTRKQCDGPKVQIRDTRDVHDHCETGQTKKIECNTCQCHAGNWACTEMACFVKPTA